ncbi:MAG: hypothetical protein Q4C58_13550 [Eubacteriales bacterium]|nr:hypothetical protein [Eubacteriales bacterium]
MLGIFCGMEATSDEAYRKYVKRRILALAGLIAAGIITALVALAAEYVWTVNVSDLMLGVYTGVGMGLTAGGIVLLIKNVLLLKDEKKIRRARISVSDERNIQISIRAVRAAVAVLIAAMYFTILIGGLWYPILAKIVSFLLILFLFSYVVAYRVISRMI